MRYALLTFCLGLSATVTAQHVVVPDYAASTSQSSHDWGPGSGKRARRMILVDMPASLHSRSLTEIAFRRDANEINYTGGSADLVVTVSHAPRPAVQAVPSFAQNHGVNPTTAFQGRTSIAATPPTSARTVQWANTTDVISIPITPPFPFTTGTLTIEIESRPVVGQSSRFWAVDGVVEELGSSVTRLGESCSPFARTLKPEDIVSSLVAPADRLVLGSTMGFAASGTPGATAVFALGFASANIDLAAIGIGAPGCHLRVLDSVNATNTFTAISTRSEGRANYHLQLPVDLGIANLSFYMQAIEFGVPVITSEAAHCTIGNGIPTLGIATVHADIESAALPLEGSVTTTRAPVIRFSYR